MPTYVRAMLGGLIGALVGFGVYKFVGCKTGACPLSGNPWIATILWGLNGRRRNRNVTGSTPEFPRRRDPRPVSRRIE